MTKLGTIRRNISSFVEHLATHGAYHKLFAETEKVFTKGKLDEVITKCYATFGCVTERKRWFTGALKVAKMMVGAPPTKRIEEDLAGMVEQIVKVAGGLTPTRVAGIGKLGCEEIGVGRCA